MSAAQRLRIGIAFNLRKGTAPPGGCPEDDDEEFDSPETVEALADVLRRAGHEPLLLGYGRELAEKLLRDPPAAVFNIAEGVHGRSREGIVPSLLEMLGVPYTGSDPLALSLTLDKDLAKRVVASHGLPTPEHRLLRTPGDLDGDSFDSLLPAVIKPAHEGSSKGIRLSSKVHSTAALRERARWLFRDYGGPVLVENFCDGEEFTVGVLGNSPPRVFGIMMIRHRTLPPGEFLYSLEVKRNWEEEVEYLVPPPLPEALLDEIGGLALGTFRALGCRDVARVDIRMRGGRPHFLEINPLPGLSPRYGDLPIMAQRLGRGYDELVLEILAHALARSGDGKAAAR